MLPEDLKRWVRVCVLKRILLFLLLLLLLCAAVTVCALRAPEHRAWILIAGYVISLLAASLLSGMPAKLFDRSYAGRVTRVEVVVSADNTSAVKPTREQLYDKSTVFLTVVTASGRSLRKKVWEGRAGMPAECDLFCEGDTVFHLRGARHTVRLPAGTRATVCCAVCGEENKRETNACRVCGHTLVKRVESL